MLDEFTTAYIETALWSSNDENGESLDRNYSTEDIAEETLEKMKKDCEKFQSENNEIIGRESEAGHNFWLTRNGHGAGFFSLLWDGVWEKGEKLTESSNEFGEFNLYVGDDNLIHGY